MAAKRDGLDKSSSVAPLLQQAPSMRNSHPSPDHALPVHSRCARAQQQQTDEYATVAMQKEGCSTGSFAAPPKALQRAPSAPNLMDFGTPTASGSTGSALLPASPSETRGSQLSHGA